MDKQILICDDDPHVKRVLGLTLQKGGYEVVTAANGAEGLQKIRENAPDVLITDVMMPQMTGRELCQQIHKDMPDRDFIIIVMTSMAERDQKEWVNDIPGIEFHEKPLSPKRIKVRLDTYFREK